MKSSLLEYPLKVFILEDQAPILDDCVGRMERSFRGGLLIEKYECRMDALEAIRRADRLSEPYDAAILDLKVPDHPGEDDYADMRVPKLFFELFGSTKTQLLQWTAYPEDKAIAEFIRDFGLPKQGHTYEVLSKENIDWPYIMKDFLLRASAEKHLGRVLDDPSLELLRSEEGVGCGVGQRGLMRSTINIPAFVLMLVASWEYLAEHRRHQAERTFKGTMWEIESLEGSARLRHESARRKVEEAEALAEALRAAARPASSDAVTL